MLSIGKIALGQHRYYEQQVAHGRDDYYFGRGEAPGEWVGAGSDALGLSARASSQQFSALIAGHDPRDPGERLRSSDRDPKIAALDLTFSAAKSISVLAAVGPDSLAAELIWAHEQAVRAALSYLEDTAVRMRRGHDGQRVERGEGLIAVAYRHRMSRALDPQLHTHVVAANLTRGPDGRHTALHGAPLYRAAKTAGYLYQSHLRALVSERLGLTWGEVHKGAAELEGVPNEVLAEFSKRRREMLREAESGGIPLTSKAAAESAAIATRDRKRYGIETHTWREEVRARAGELGLTRAAIAALIERGRRRTRAGLAMRDRIDERALGDRLAGPRGLTERANTFDERVVLQQYAVHARSGLSVDEVRAHSHRFTRRSDVIRTDRGEMTTTELVAYERRLIAAALGRAREGTGIVDPDFIRREISRAPFSLTTEQAAAVNAAVNSGDGVSVIEALAGTGKTFTVGVLGAIYGRAGHEVLGVAPTARAARELSEQASIPSRTLDRLLLDVEQLGDELPRRCVVILDEAGMAPTRSTAALLALAARAKAKVIAIGDPGQLASVQAGGWLRAVGRGLGALRLTEVTRQRDPRERCALEALHEREPHRYLQWAQSARRIETFDTPEAALERAVGEWQQAVRNVGPTQAVMVARNNDTRDSLNTAARELWRALGLLGEERTYGSHPLAQGERVICRRNAAMIEVDNGMRATVRHLERDRVVIETDGGLVRELPAAYVAEHLEHAYAVTGHGMQGGTVERAIVVTSPRDLTAGWSYTALSRARGVTRLLVYDQGQGAERGEYAPAEQTRAEAKNLRARVEKHMRERDDEDLAIEQLPGAGRADDPAVAGSRELAAQPAQERAAMLAESAPRAALAPARRWDLRERIEQLQGQLEALPTRQLERIENLDARALTLNSQREQLAKRLAALHQPQRRSRCEQDLHAGERSHLTSILRASERDLDAVLTQHRRLERELGDPAEMRAERDELQSAITQLTQEHTQLRNELDERELHPPDAWVREGFGARPDRAWTPDEWEARVRQVARDRARYDIADSSDALGLRPASEQRNDWERTREAIERGQRRLGRDAGANRDVDLGIWL